MLTVSIHAPVRVRPGSEVAVPGEICFNSRTREGATLTSSQHSSHGMFQFTHP